MNARNEQQYREAWKGWAKELATLCMAANQDWAKASKDYNELRAKIDELIDQAAKLQEWEG